MKTKIVIFVLSTFLIFCSHAQVVQDFESGDRQIERGNCWYFSSVSINGGINAISGSHGARTGQLSGGNHFIISPHIDLTANNQISFKHKMTANNGSSRNLKVQVIDDNDQVIATLYDHTYSGNYTSLINASVTNTVSGIYRVKFLFTGSGGNSRGLLDDISIPGVFADDITSSDGYGNCTAAQTVTDTDGDGVEDESDNYPNDVYRAYDIILPNGSGWASLAFEDLWPAKGDWDFNDLVVDYQLKIVSNASNEIVEIYTIFSLRAIGAGFHNAFAFELLQVPQSKVISVTGYEVEPGGIFSINSNGLENNQSNASIIVFDDAYNVLQHPGDTTGINTIQGATYVTPDTMTIKMTFIESGVPASGGTIDALSFSLSQFNPFIIIDGVRGRELHQPDFPPTDLANYSYFGTAQDDSNPATGKFYKTEQNLPWVLNIIEKFTYPVEKHDITKGHLKFSDWVQSNGNDYSDWYQNKPNYRDDSKLYQ